MIRPLVAAAALALVAAALAALSPRARADGFRHNFAGSVQIDYLAVPTDRYAAS